MWQRTDAPLRKVVGICRPVRVAACIHAFAVRATAVGVYVRTQTRGGCGIHTCNSAAQ
jgi:hypothetical protein